jgi:hypothetical protein
LRPNTACAPAGNREERLPSFRRGPSNHDGTLTAARHHGAPASHSLVRPHPSHHRRVDSNQTGYSEGCSTSYRPLNSLTCQCFPMDLAQFSKDLPLPSCQRARSSVTSMERWSTFSWRGLRISIARPVDEGGDVEPQAHRALLPSLPSPSLVLPLMTFAFLEVVDFLLAPRWTIYPSG